MSHSLHRSGPASRLHDDWIVLAMSAKDVNKDGSGAKLRRFLEIALRHGPVNWGDIRQGSRFSRRTEDLLDGIRDESVVHAVFTDENAVSSFLDELRRADLGVSVIVSGLIDNIEQAADRAGLEPHTTARSLGVWGRTERLPSPEILEVTTMCGHGLVAANLVRTVMERVREGSLAPEEGAEILARPCVCGIFNPSRAAKCLSRTAAAGRSGPEVEDLPRRSGEGRLSLDPDEARLPPGQSHDALDPGAASDPL